MAINDFKPFAIGSNANVMTQSDYEALPALSSGFQAGKAASAQVNKAIRQGTVMASTLAQFIANGSGSDVLDDNDMDSLLANLKIALDNLFSGRLAKLQVFTASGTYIPTNDVKIIRVTITGGGGGGVGCSAKYQTDSFSGSGGGGGATVIGISKISEISNFNVVVGSGGLGNSGPYAAGNGGDSSFNGMTAGGGGGGNKTTNVVISGGNPGVGSGGALNISGGYGTDGQNGSNFIYGSGGASYYGGGGRAGVAGGKSGSAYGSGGGGAFDLSLSGNSYPGGDGRSGVVIIEEYF